MQEFEEAGVIVIRGRLSEARFAKACAVVDSMLVTALTGAPGARAFNLPNPLAGGDPTDERDVRSALTTIAADLAGKPVRLVRILAFDKTPRSNWGVQWHQDRTIAVRQRADVPGFGPWSVKAGTPHVEPPQALLEQMFVLRLHLDDCGADNGPLKVVPGSHKLGRIPAKEVLRLGASSQPQICTVRASDIVAMKALTVHASDPAAAPRHRRVLHLDFSMTELPAPLQWAIA